MTGVNDYNDVEFDHIVERLSLFWLDANVNITEDNQKTQKRLRSIINELQVFDNLSRCQQTIQALSEQDRLILIVSGQLGREFVPQIHQLRQLISIYVYCGNKDFNKEWAEKFSKVKDVIVEQDDLIIQIKLHLKSRVILEEPMSYNIYNMTPEPKASTSKFNDDFIHSLILINGLLRLNYTPRDNHGLISHCKKEYTDYLIPTKMSKEFKEDYKSHHALWWYTRESFLYRILGEALCKQTIKSLLVFRGIINDVCTQLKQNQYKSSIHVYRGQIMRASEVTLLRKSINGYLSIKSFLLTNSNREKILDVLNNIRIANYCKRVLFTIDADPNLMGTKTVADVSKFSNDIGGTELLFMIGSIFRLIDVEDDNDISIVHLQLSGDDEPDLYNLFETMKDLYGYRSEDNKIDLPGFGDMARQIGKYAMAETIYCQAIKELQRNDPTLSDLHCALGTISREKREHSSSLEWYQKALEIKKQLQPEDLINIGQLHGCIGGAFSCMNNDDKALEHYGKAIKLFERANATNHQHMADFYNNIGSVYKRKGKYPEALRHFEKALDIDNRRLSSERSFAAKSLNDIGIVYYELKQYDLAMNYFQQSLEMKLRTHPLPQQSIAETHRYIGNVHEARHASRKALEHYQKAHSIYNQFPPSQHQDLQQIQTDIQRIERQL